MSEQDELAGVTIEMSPELAESEQEVQKAEGEQESAKPEEGAALATAEGEDPDKTTEAEGGKPESDGAQKAINKQYRLRKEAEEQLETERQERGQLEARLREAQGLDKEPVIPEMPDQYDENFQEKLAQRDAAIRAHAEWATAQRFTAEQVASQQRQAATDAEKELEGMADSYAGRAKELGVDGQALQQASTVVTQAGVSDDLVRMLLKDPDGPLITQYLATLDPQSLDDFARMPPIEAGQFLERDVRSKAQELRPNTSNAPKPPEVLSGGGPGDDSLGRHKGVTIE